MRKSKSFRPALNDKLEDRTVPSGLLGNFSQFQSLLGGGFGRGDEGRSGFGREGRDGGEFGGEGTSSSTVLNQDARLVQQAFQSFQSSYLKAVAALRQTATSTAGPSTDGLTAFDNAIHTAITTLNAAIAKDLGNLTNTGTALNTMIDGFTADLETNLDSAATGLSNSTNSAVLSLNREAKTVIRSALQQSVSAIHDDTVAGTLAAVDIATYNQDVRDAYQTFNIAISNAEQTAIASGNKLDPTAVSNAVSVLQTDLTTAAQTDLGTTYQSSSSYPTTTLATDLAKLTSQLEAVAAPTAGNTATARLFTRTVSSVLRHDESLIGRALATAIQSYDNSLL